MKRLIGLILICMCLLSACTVSSQSIKEDDPLVNSKSLLSSQINLDELELASATEYQSTEYSKAQLQQLAQDKNNKDYMQVVHNFVEKELNSSILYVDSLDGSYNPKRLTVGTSDGDVYLFKLVRYHNYNGIWAVNQYAKLDSLDIERTIKYEEIELNQAEKVIQDWANEQIMKRQRSQNYMIVNDKVFILLTANEGENVELIDIRGNSERIVVAHGNSKLDTEVYGEKPFVLIQVHSPILEVKFNQFSEVQTEHSNLFLP